VNITRAEHWTERFQLKQPYTIAYETITAAASQIVRIDTDIGLFGLGAASPAPDVTGETLADTRTALDDHLARLLVGQNARRLDVLLRGLQQAMSATPAARAAVDMALYDLTAKSLDIPLVDLWGRAHRSLPTSITLGIASPEEAVAAARALVDQGFRILKIKLGKSLADDLERLRRIRAQVGRQIALRVDINQGYSVGQFKDFMQHTQTLDLEFIEQPLAAADVDGMRRFSARVRRRTVADESLITPADALAYSCQPQPFGIYNIKLMKCGGIHPALKIAAIADSAGIDLMWGCNDESIISISAALHAALASPATRYLDLDGSLDLVGDLVTGGFVLKDGQLSVTGAPGLGVALI
jgi:L-alanine-DL-glutamate epimerase-like enolase superfamily enzyme